MNGILLLMCVAVSPAPPEMGAPTPDPVSMQAASTDGSGMCQHPGIFKAVELVKAYRNNQAYAAEFIEGKEIQVSGRMLRLKRLPADASNKEKFAIALSPDGKPATDVGLTFIFEDENRCRLAQLKPGQFLSVKGVYMETASDPETNYTEVKFQHCKLPD